MKIFNRDTHIDFMRQRRVAMVFSLVLIAVSVGSLVVNQLKFGIDFTGGTQVEVGYEEPVTLQPVRDALDKAGFNNFIVQHFGTSRDVLIRLAPVEDADKKIDKSNFNAKVLEALQDTGTLELRRVDFVGPQVGEELTEQGGLAVLYALFFILAYVTLRFEFRFAVGSVAALAHDVIIVVGAFSILQYDFDLTVLAAILAVIGYSLNDTIVVFDRIRENFRKMRKADAIEVVNSSINQMLGRTIVTSLTTLLVLLALFILGGEVIRGFALALIIGIVVGTYSSIYVASAAALALGVSKQDLIQPKKEGEPIDDMP
ncbi:MAG: protein translocase subunit SecF [Gammaproteobacteria bacterium]|nr:protein translocase subunit SecF [Gammaproteobacteria bacterium]